MNQSYDVLIVGGGMVGLSVACLLGQNEQLNVSLVDAGSRPEFKPGNDRR